MKNRWCAAVPILILLFALVRPVGGGTPTVETIDTGRGAVNVYLPSTYDPCEALPLVVTLHGYGGNSASQEFYFNLLTQIESRRFIYCVPNGTTDPQGYQFWNAGAACCDFFGSGVDDSAYLRGLIDAVGAVYNVDDRSVHCMGLSNGGFMSYRMACDHADAVASVVVMAGAMPADPGVCVPAAPVSVLHIHGTSDTTVLYGGGFLGANGYAGAEQSVAAWVGSDLCDPGAAVVDPAIDLDASIAGDETTRVRYTDQCADGAEVALWTVHGGEHLVSLVDYDAGEGAGDNRLAALAVDWMLSHPKPAASTPWRCERRRRC